MAYLNAIFHLIYVTYFLPQSKLCHIQLKTFQAAGFNCGLQNDFEFYLIIFQKQWVGFAFIIFYF